MVTPERFAERWRTVRDHAEAAGRDPGALIPALQLRRKFDDDAAAAKAVIAPTIKTFCHVPFARFERCRVSGNAGR